MKSFLFLIFVCSLSFHLVGQIAQIHIDITKHCIEIYSDDIAIQLYRQEGDDIIFLEEKNLPSVTFEGLDSNLIYIVKTFSNDVKARETSVRDLVNLRNHIFNIYSLHPKAILAGDVNQSGGISTLDLVLLQRYLMDIDDNINKNYSFIKSDYNLSSSNEISVFKVDQFVNNEAKLDLVAIKKGEVSANMPVYCQGECHDIYDEIISINVLNKEVVAGIPVKFMVSFNNLKQFGALGFALKWVDGNVDQILPKANTLYNLNTNEKLIKIIYLDHMVKPDANANKELLEISFLPNKSGKIADFFTLVQDDKLKEAVLNQSKCAQRYFNLVIDFKIDFESECVISWPKDITINDCIDKINTGRPTVKSDCESNFAMSFSDQIVEECRKVLRIWTVINWQTASWDVKIQTITIIKDFQHICNYNVITDLKDGPKLLKARDMVQNPKEGHLYSFSEFDDNDTIRLITYEKPYDIEFYIYNRNYSNQFCIVRVSKILCTEPNVSILISPNIQVVFNDDYIVKADAFDLGSSSNCASIGQFQISFDGQPFKSSITFGSDYAGETVSFVLRYKLGDQFQIHGSVMATLVPLSMQAPLEMFLYNDYLISGQTYEIPIYASNFNEMIAFQLAINLKEAQWISLVPGVLSSPELLHNYQFEVLRLLWLEKLTIPFSTSNNQPLFYIKIMPTSTGNVSNFISLNQTALMPQAVYKDVVSGQINLTLVYKERSTSSIDEIANQKMDFVIFPNPLQSDLIQVQTFGHYPTQPEMVLTDIVGKVLVNFKNVDKTRDNYLKIPNHIPNGVYIFSIKERTHINSKKLIINR